MDIEITGARANLESEGYDFGDVRVGAAPNEGGGSGEQTVQIANALEDDGDPTSNYRAEGVDVAAVATGGFTGAGVTDITVPGGDSGNVYDLTGYTFAPTGLGDGQTTTVSVDSGDARDINYGKSSQGELVLTGNGVSPDPRLQAYDDGTKVYDYTGSAIHDTTLDFFDAGNPVDIGETEIRNLILTNIFGKDSNDATDLTILDLVIANDTAGVFSLNLGALPDDPVLADTSYVDLAGRLANAPFSISFTPNGVGDFSALLNIVTDVGTGKGLRGEVYTVNLFGTGTSDDNGNGGGLPIPSSIALIAIGLGALRLRRRRR